MDRAREPTYVHVQNICESANSGASKPNLVFSCTSDNVKDHLSSKVNIRKSFLLCNIGYTFQI